MSVLSGQRKPAKWWRPGFSEPASRKLRLLSVPQSFMRIRWQKLRSFLCLTRQTLHYLSTSALQTSWQERTACVASDICRLIVSGHRSNDVEVP